MTEYKIDPMINLPSSKRLADSVEFRDIKPFSIIHNERFKRKKKLIKQHDLH